MAMSETAFVSANWVTFVEHLSQKINESTVTNESLALFILEISDFHHYIARHGFQAGEKLIEAVRASLMSEVNHLSHMQRIASDRFALILAGHMEPELLSLGADKIIQTLANQLEVDGKQVHVTATLGGASFPHQASTAEGLIAYALSSLKTANDMGYPYYLGVTDEEVSPADTWSLTNELKNALVAEGLFLAYQPKLDLRSNQVTCSEALMRWRTQDKRLVPPSRFIPIAENSGIIHDLTDWAIHTALREITQLSVPEKQLGVAINLSSSSVYDENLLTTLSSALEIWGLAPDCLTLEITESVLIREPQKCFRNLSALRDSGIKISIDDFGTGYSSFSYFKNIPATELKIDQSFVRAMTSSEDDARIVEMIIELSHKFGLKVVAEGVEDRPTLDFLSKLGCDFAQGYYVSKPLSIQELQDFLAA